MYVCECIIISKGKYNNEEIKDVYMYNYLYVHIYLSHTENIWYNSCPSFVLSSKVEKLESKKLIFFDTIAAYWIHTQ